MGERERFDELRARYLASQKRRAALFDVHRAKYGSGYETSWLKAGERKAEERADAAVGKAGDAFIAHLKTFSPRDWSYGVPVAWVLESLTFEDAARSVGETLSVVPPLSFGATRPRT